MAAVPSAGVQAASGSQRTPSCDRNRIASAGGCWTPTATKPSPAGAIPNSWLAAAGWQGEQWYPGSSDGAWVTTSGWTTSAEAQDPGPVAAVGPTATGAVDGPDDGSTLAPQPATRRAARSPPVTNARAALDLTLS